MLSTLRGRPHGRGSFEVGALQSRDWHIYLLCVRFSLLNRRGRPSEADLSKSVGGRRGGAPERGRSIMANV